jgi:ParB family chromosome partitioning protein
MAKTDRRTKAAQKGKKTPKVTSYQELPIGDIDIVRFQVRKQNVGENLDELAASIEKYGLLQPIVVCKSAGQPGKWEIVAGQRRYLAFKQILKLPKIMAGIIDHPIEYEEGLALCASENVVRLDMTRKDLIDLCADLFKRYGTIKDVVDETKLPYPIVRKYIRFDGLPSDLQEKVNNSEINVDLAMKVQDAASSAGSYDEKEANKLIKVLKTVDNPIQKKIIDLRKKNPTVSLDKIVKKAEEPDQTLKLQLTLGETLATPLRKFAEDEDTDEKTAVEGFIESCLKENGYMDTEE